jgi:8-oxo-dGTP pyrophosphatase MutT (NUDIX family)
MLHLIEHLLPARLHRAALPVAHKVRHRWRRWRRVELHGVSVVIANDAGEVLLLRHSYGPDNWALPGGGMGKDEEPVLAARREVREELAIELEQLEKVSEMREVVSGSPHTAYIFGAVAVGEPTPDQREIIEARFFKPLDLPQDISNLTRRRIAQWKAHCGRQKGEAPHILAKRGKAKKAVLELREEAVLPESKDRRASDVLELTEEAPPPAETNRPVEAHAPDKAHKQQKGAAPASPLVTQKKPVKPRKPKKSKKPDPPSQGELPF